MNELPGIPKKSENDPLLAQKAAARKRVIKSGEKQGALGCILLLLVIVLLIAGIGALKILSTHFGFTIPQDDGFWYGILFFFSGLGWFIDGLVTYLRRRLICQ